MYLNKVLLYGNLTRDPEVRALPSGGQVVTFGLATNRSFKGKDGAQQEQTEFHNIVAFGRLAEVMGQYLKKGRPVYVEGRLQTRCGVICSAGCRVTDVMDVGSERPRRWSIRFYL